MATYPTETTEVSLPSSSTISEAQKEEAISTGIGVSTSESDVSIFKTTLPDGNHAPGADAQNKVDPSTTTSKFQFAAIVLALCLAIFLVALVRRDGAQDAGEKCSLECCYLTPSGVCRTILSSRQPFPPSPMHSTLWTMWHGMVPPTSSPHVRSSWCSARPTRSRRRNTSLSLPSFSSRSDRRSVERLLARWH